MNNERYNQIIDEAYENYKNYMQENFMETRWNKVLEIHPYGSSGRIFYRDEFINKCKTDPEFSKKWNLQIKETYDLIPHTEYFGDVTITKAIRRNKLIVKYKDKKIEVYE